MAAGASKWAIILFELETVSQSTMLTGKFSRQLVRFYGFLEFAKNRKSATAVPKKTPKSIKIKNAFQRKLVTSSKHCMIQSPMTPTSSAVSFTIR